MDLFFVHEFKSIYTEYTIEMIVPEGYVVVSWLVPRPFDRGLTLLERRVILYWLGRG